MKKRLKKRILVSITGYRQKDWSSKLGEIEKHQIKRIALFLEMFNKGQRKKIYSALLSSNIKKIPLVHARNDMSRK